MENDQVFDTEARLENASPSSSPPRYTSRRRGHDKLISSYGGTEGYKATEIEDTPLLSRDHGDEFQDSASSRGEARLPPQWHGERDFEGKNWWNRPSVFKLLPLFLLSTLAFGGIVVPKLNLIISLICEDYLAERSIKDPDFRFMPVMIGEENPQCRDAQVQKLVAKFTLYLALVAGILSAVTSPKLGALSDRYGRTKVIAFTTFGMLCSEFVTILAATFPETVSIWWLLVGYGIDGICGSFTAAMAVTNAYASDCTPPTKRAETFGYFYGVLFTGIALGPFLAGYIVKATGNIISVFYVALVCHFVFFFCMLFVIPESLSKERQMSAREKHSFTREGESFTWTWAALGKSVVRGGGIFAPLKILWPTGEGSNYAVRRNLVFLAAVDTTMFGVAMGSMTVVIIYAEYMYGWDTYDSSIFISIINTCRVSVLVIVLPLMTRFIRRQGGNIPQKNSGSDSAELIIIRTAIAFDVLGYIGFATARTGSMMILSGAVASIGGMGSPTLASALTKHVPPDRVGQLLGATGLLHALARVVAPTIFNTIYYYTVENFSQAVFVCLGSAFGVAFILSWFIRPHVYFDEPEAAAPATRPDGFRFED